MFTQNLRGRLVRDRQVRDTDSLQPFLSVNVRQAGLSHLLVFQMWTVSGSSMPCFSAMSSRKSKKNLTAIGGGRFVLRIATKTSSTNFCRVPYRERQVDREVRQVESERDMEGNR